MRVSIQDVIRWVLKALPEPSTLIISTHTSGVKPVMLHMFDASKGCGDLAMPERVGFGDWGFQ